MASILIAPYKPRQGLLYVSNARETIMITAYDNLNFSFDLATRTPVGQLSNDFKRMLRVQFKEFIHALDEAERLSPERADASGKGPGIKAEYFAKPG